MGAKTDGIYLAIFPHLASISKLTINVTGNKSHSLAVLYWLSAASPNLLYRSVGQLQGEHGTARLLLTAHFPHARNILPSPILQQSPCLMETCTFS